MHELSSQRQHTSVAQPAENQSDLTRRIGTKGAILSVGCSSQGHRAAHPEAKQPGLIASNATYATHAKESAKPIAVPRTVVRVRFASKKGVDSRVHGCSLSRKRRFTGTGETRRTRVSGEKNTWLKRKCVTLQLNVTKMKCPFFRLPSHLLGSSLSNWRGDGTSEVTFRLLAWTPTRGILLQLQEAKRPPMAGGCWVGQYGVCAVRQFQGQVRHLHGVPPDDPMMCLARPAMPAGDGVSTLRLADAGIAATHPVSATMKIFGAAENRTALPFDRSHEALRQRFIQGCEVPLRHTHVAGIVRELCALRRHHRRTVGANRWK